MTAAAPTTDVAIGCLAIAIQAPGEAAPNPRRRAMTVITALNERGELRTDDGRIYHYPAGAAALAEALNAQAMAVRIDVDHQSEPSSPTFRGATAAEGWVTSFSAAGGAVTGIAELGPYAAYLIEAGQYRYVSPALLHDAEGRIRGLSSVALTNRPALGPAAHLQRQTDMPPSPPTDDAAREARLAEREAAITAREQAADTRELAALTADIDRAVAAGTFTEAEKPHLLALAAAPGEARDTAYAAVRAILTARTPTPSEGDGRAVPPGPGPGTPPGAGPGADTSHLTKRLPSADAAPGSEGPALASRHANTAVALRAQRWIAHCASQGRIVSVPEAVDAVRANLDRE